MPINRKEVEEKLEKSGVVGIVGIYGSGKVLIVDWLVRNMVKKGDVVARVSFKDLPKPSAADIPMIAGQASWAALHASWRRQALACEKKNSNLWIIIEEAQVVEDSGEQLWEIINSLRYYQKNFVIVVITGQPLLLDTRQLILARILRGRVVFPRLVSSEEMKRYTKHSLSEASLRTLVGGHWGTLKYIERIRQDLGRVRLTKSRLIKVVKDVGEMPYFARVMWAGLSMRQQQVVASYIRTGKVDLSQKTVQDLINARLFRKNGGKVSWFVPWTLEYVREYLEELPRSEMVVDESCFGKKEKRIYRILKSAPGKVVSYDELIEQVWGGESEKTLWTVSRLVGRVKEKMRRQGWGGLIEIVRGVGYKYSS